MPFRIARLLVVIALGLALPAWAESPVAISQADRQAFQSLYQDKLNDVKRTAASDDDRELLAQMLEIAERIPDDPGLQCLIYINTIPLSLNSGDLASLERSVERLESLSPGHPAAQADSLLKQAGSAYRGARRDDRERIADLYLDLLLDRARALAELAEYREALRDGKQAIAVARAVDSSRIDLAESVYREIDEAYDLAKRIDRLTRALERSPQNVPAARELVNLLVVRRDDPAAAAAFAELTEDADARAALPILEAGMDEASPEEAALVGGWYAKLAEGEEDRYAARLLGHARNWYARFFETYDKRDALMLQAQATDKAVTLRLAQLIQRDGWKDLIAETFDPDRHSLRPGRLTVRDGSILTKEGWFVLPVYPKGGYDLRITMTPQSAQPGGPTIVVYIPVASSGGTVRYWHSGEDVVSIGQTDVAMRVPGRGSAVGDRVEVLIQVRPKDEPFAAINLLVDGKQAADWQGRVHQLEQPDHVKPPEQFGNAIGILGAKTVALELHAIEYREVDD
ncbi:MAG: tetratricopeptide repeat protein [Phycisphaeraceae bacterium]